VSIRRAENVGSGERVVRVIVGVALAVAAIVVPAGGAAFWGWVGALLALAVGTVLIVTGARGHCALYARLGHVPRSLQRAAGESAGTWAATGSATPQRRLQAATGNGPVGSPVAPADAEAGDAGVSRPGPPAEGTELVAECEVVLCGRYAEHLGERQRRVPAWARVNLLAHGTAEDLQTANALGGQAGTQRWRAERAYLAGEVLGTADQGIATLGDLQRDVVVPVELHLASPERTSALTPSELVACLLAALDAHQRAQRHRASTGPTTAPTRSRDHVSSTPPPDRCGERCLVVQDRAESMAGPAEPRGWRVSVMSGTPSTWTAPAWR